MIDFSTLRIWGTTFKPAKDQKFFLKGGSIDYPKYRIEGPETLPFSKMIEKGYKLPFYADLSALPEYERRVIWGMMVGEEGKTKIPIYKNYAEAGFDPRDHVLQCYGTGWTSASFLLQERQLFGLSRLKEFEKSVVPQTFAYNPHELVRLLEVFDILTVAQIIIEASLARKTSSKPLCFNRGDSIEDESMNKKLIIIKQLDGKIEKREVPVDYFGNLKENYEKYNQDYIRRDR